MKQTAADIFARAIEVRGRNLVIMSESDWDALNQAIVNIKHDGKVLLPAVTRIHLDR